MLCIKMRGGISPRCFPEKREDCKVRICQGKGGDVQGV